MASGSGSEDFSDEECLTMNQLARKFCRWKWLISSFHLKIHLKWRDFISSVEIFKRIISEDLNYIASAMVVKKFNKGDIIIQSGQKPRGVFVVTLVKQNEP